MTPENEEYLADAIEAVMWDTHDYDVSDGDYAVAIVAWLKKHHPDALALIKEATQ